MAAKNLVKRGPVYYFSMNYRGARYSQSLETGDKKVAGERARWMREKIVRAQWDEVMGLRVRAVASIGEVIGVYRKLAAGFASDLTQKNGIHALRIMARRGLPAARNGEREMADAEVDKLSCAVLTGGLVAKFATWAPAKLAANSPGGVVDPAKLASVQRSAVSYALQARSLFTKARLKGYERAGLKLPNLTEFLEEPLPTPPPLQRRAPSEEEMRPLFEAAPAWRLQDPPAWMAWRLAVWTGLRRGALARLRWEWFKQVNGDWVFDFPEGVLKNGKAFTVPVHPDLALEVLAYGHQSGKVPGEEWTGFVLPGDDRLGVAWRGTKTFGAVSVWMRAHGWPHKAKLQGMRRYFLRLARAQYGLEWAQAMAGHAEASTLTRNYTGERELTGKVIEMPTFKGAAGA